MCGRWRSFFGFALTLGLCALSTSVASAAEGPQDLVVVQGERFRGVIVGLSPKGVRFSTPHSEGLLTFPYEAVEHVETAGSFRVLYSKQEEVRGRLLGIDEAHLLIGESPDSAARIPLAEIQTGVSDAEYERSLLTRLRARYRHWKAGLEAGFSIEDGGVDKRKVRVRLDLERRLAPTRYTYSIDYAIDTEQRRDDPEPKTTKDELYSYFRGERDIVDRLPAFALVGVEWDRPRGVDLRTFIGTGIGYRPVDTDRVFLLVYGGFGFVYEEFKQDPNNHYPAGLVALDFILKLPRESELRISPYYFPGIPEPSENWLFRMESVLTVPIWGPLALKARVNQVNDNNPSPNTGNNKTETVLGFSLLF